LIINEVEGGKLVGIEPTDDNLVDIAKVLIDLGVKERVIIHTPKMGVCYHSGKATILNSYDLPKDFIKGTTGAGDAFCAGALLAIYNDLSDLEILEYATYSSTVSLTSVDATSAIKTIEESKEFCKNFIRR
jgi:sugar/nucleoside kinase (ribokinase family)